MYYLDTKSYYVKLSKEKSKEIATIVIDKLYNPGEDRWNFEWFRSISKNRVVLENKEGKPSISIIVEGFFNTPRLCFGDNSGVRLVLKRRDAKRVKIALNDVLSNLPIHT